jgi:hypothetical protein
MVSYGDLAVCQPMVMPKLLTVQRCNYLR